MPTKIGQNFLKNNEIVKKIVAAANLQVDDLVLEIGPGKGILTEELAKKAGKVVAVEIDENLVDLLKGKFKDYKNVEIIGGDILKIDLNKILTTNDQRPTTYNVIANLPYYITSPIIRMFLEAGYPPEEMIIMVQKEVAERIVAKPGQMSILAVSVQYYADAEMLFEVGKENFDPIPEVDSAVIRISQIKKSDEKQINTNKFFRVVRAGFCAKRKTLANNLANSFHLDRSDVEEKIKYLKIKNTARAQELSVEDWKKLSELFT
jgi:16S rRNA (adenine1518-N6/adenine1519-N6)-dimethyltransferase